MSDANRYHNIENTIDHVKSRALLVSCHTSYCLCVIRRLCWFTPEHRNIGQYPTSEVICSAPLFV